VLYETRQKLKAANNGAHIGIKLGLNSLYGKFAQQIGYDEVTKKIPPYHNLAIAGYITSYCRAMMVEATMQNPGAIIAYETDGIFSTAELNLPVGKGLGQWDLMIWDDLYYFQSGFRFGIMNGEVSKAATRGIPSKDISLNRMKAEITNMLSRVVIMQTNFITLQLATARNRLHTAGNWITAPRVLQVMQENLDGKRIHDPDCYMCDVDKEGIRSYRWEAPHLTVPHAGYEGTLSCPHPVLWSDVGNSVPLPEPKDIEIAP
jgi:hypothetical protein